MSKDTCPYCGTELRKTEGAFHCLFCQMKISKHIAQKEGKRLVVRKRDFIQMSQLEQSTRLLKKLSTYELLELYHFIRTEEHAEEMYRTLAGASTTPDAVMNDSVGEVTSLMWKRKKRYVLENLLRERFGYIPEVSTRYLETYRERIRQDEKTLRMESEG